MESFNSLAKVKARLADIAPDIALTKTDCGEYRVTFKIEFIGAALQIAGRPAQIEKAESLAAYETDLESAYETALAMVKTMARNLPPVETPARQTIDLTPTWESLIPTFVMLIENGDAKGRATAIDELKRVAAFADSVIAERKESGQ